MYRAEMLHVI